MRLLYKENLKLYQFEEYLNNIILCKLVTKYNKQVYIVSVYIKHNKSKQIMKKIKNIITDL